MLPYFLLGLMLAAVIAMYLPHAFVARREQFSRQQFIKMHPQFKWLRFDLAIDFGIFLLAISSSSLGLLLLQTPASLGLFVLLLAGLAVWNGVLTATTGICRVPYVRLPYQYIQDENLRGVGWSQAILGLLTIGTALAITLF